MGESRHTGRARVAPAVCAVLGVVVLLAVAALLAVPLVAGALGVQVLSVHGTSMQPAIPDGSAVVVSPCDPQAVAEGDVIAYERGGMVTVHRVRVNRASLGEFVTKGDAMDAEDAEPVPYDALLGRVEAQAPEWGHLLGAVDSMWGRVYLAIAAACGVMFLLLARRMRAARA